MKGRLRTVLSAVAVLAAIALVPACAPPDTSRLSPEQQQRLAAEGIVRRGDNLPFRYTHRISGMRDGWEEYPASIVVTSQTILIHQNDRLLLEITPRSTGEYSVRREGDRVTLRAGSGGSVRNWAFHPAKGAVEWATDLRAVIKGTAGAKRRR